MLLYVHLSRLPHRPATTPTCMEAVGFGLDGIDLVHPEARRGSSARDFPRMSHNPGYTIGMKTAISVPTEVFEQAERLARRQGRSRSELYSAAVREYVARHSPDDVTDAIDRVVADLGEEPAAFRRAAAKRVLRRVEW